MAASELYTTTLFGDSNLQAYYRLEGNGTDSKNSNNLTLVNTPSTVAGKFNNALDFEYSSSQCARGTLTAPTGAFTITGWMNIKSVITSDSLLVFGNVSGTDSTGMTIISTNKIRFMVNGSQVIESDATFSLDTWTFIAVVNDGTNKKIVINNIIKSTANGTAPSTTSTFGIACGGAYTSANSDSIFDDVAYFDRALSDTELLNLYQGSSVSSFFMNFV